MRKIVSGFCVALSATAGLAFAAPANAEGVATSAGEVQPMLWMHGGWFKNITECAYVGDEGKSIGRWRAFSCIYEYNKAPDKSEPWELDCDYI